MERIPLFRDWLISKCILNGEMKGYTNQCLFARIVYNDTKFPRFREFSVRKQKRIITDYLFSCRAGKKTMRTFFVSWDEYIEWVERRCLN